MSKKSFRGRLEAVGPGGAWTFLKIPFSVERVFGSRARVAVKGTINGFAFRTSVHPVGDGTHSMMINKAMQQGANAKPGDRVRMVLEPDTAKRRVTVPRDLKAALAKNNKVRETFGRLAYQKAYVDWIVEAKQAATRERRIAKAIEMLAAGLKRM